VVFGRLGARRRVLVILLASRSRVAMPLISTMVFWAASTGCSALHFIAAFQVLIYSSAGDGVHGLRDMAGSTPATPAQTTAVLVVGDYRAHRLRALLGALVYGFVVRGLPQSAAARSRARRSA